SVTAEKVIEVKQRSTITADIYLCSKSDGRYVRDQGPYRARLGHNGTTADKREGDGKTPQGGFWLREGFGTAAEPVLPKSWTKVNGYNTMQLKSEGYPGESLYQPKPYKYAQVIGYNEARTPARARRSSSTRTPSRLRPPAACRCTNPASSRRWSGKGRRRRRS